MTTSQMYSQGRLPINSVVKEIRFQFHDTVAMVIQIYFPIITRYTIMTIIIEMNTIIITIDNQVI